MASLTYLVYSFLTLVAHDERSTYSSLNAWSEPPVTEDHYTGKYWSDPPVTEDWTEKPYHYTGKSWSDPPVTEDWTEEPYHYTGKYSEESCPSGETWSDCDSNCQQTCENVGEPVICPRMCIPGCVCEDPGAVRGPDGKCISPPLCPSADRIRRVDQHPRNRHVMPAWSDPPVTEDWTEEPYHYTGKSWSDPPVTEDWTEEPYHYTGKYSEESCPSGETWSDCDSNCQQTCENVGQPVICPRMCIPGCVCEEPGAVRGPDGKCIFPPLCPSADRIRRVDQHPRNRHVTPGKINTGDCSTNCSTKCKSDGFKWGICTGPENNICTCYKRT